jgi:hypothetical protein
MANRSVGLIRGTSGLHPGRTRLKLENDDGGIREEQQIDAGGNRNPPEPHVHCLLFK